MLAENQHWHRQLRFHNSIRQFIAYEIGEDLHGLPCELHSRRLAFLSSSILSKH